MEKSFESIVNGKMDTIISEKTESLLTVYGVCNKADIKELSDKFNIIIAAHKGAGIEGNNPLCKLNKDLKSIISTINMVKTVSTY